MHLRLVRTLLLPLAFAAITGTTDAGTPPAGIVPQHGSVSFRFATSVQTPKGTHSGSGTIVVKRTGPRAVSLTVRSDDGKPPHSSTLSMTGSATQYTGRTRAETTTQLPAGGSLDPTQIAKTIGVTAEGDELTRR